MEIALERRGRLHSKLLIAAAIAVSALMSLLLRSDYLQAEAAAETAARNLAITLDARIETSFFRIDAALDGIASDMQEAGSAHDTIRRAAIEGKLRSLSRRFPELVAYQVTDAGGNVLHSSTDSRPILPAGQDWFRAAQAAPQQVATFSRILPDGHGGPGLMIVAKPMRDRAGEFIGAALAIVDVGVFAAIFRDVNIGRRGAVGLRRSDDLTLVTRWPAIPDSVNHPVASPIASGLAAGQLEGSRHFVTPVDGIDRLYAFRRVASFPFVIAVALASDDYLAGWWHLVLLALTAGVVGIAVLFYYLRRAAENRRRDASMVLQLRDSEELHRAIVQQAGDGIDLIDLETLRYVEVSQASCAMLGYSASEMLSLRLSDVEVSSPETKFPT